MAESGQPRAGEVSHNLANGSMQGGGYPAAAIEGDVVVRAEKTRLGGSIVIGIAVGAVAAFLVGGLVGIHENGTGVVLVDQTSVTQQSAP